MKKIFTFLLVAIITQSVFADMTCDVGVSRYDAKYESNTYTCSSGQFLPANVDGCVACPTGNVCSGGTFTFNENYFQGLGFILFPNSTMNNVCASNFPTKLDAKYEPNSHDCSAGYYLPANVDECTICPTGYTCGGGTFIFNETTDQGLVVNNINIVWKNQGTTVTNTCTYGGAITIPDNPIRTGYVFTGWQVD